MICQCPWSPEGMSGITRTEIDMRNLGAAIEYAEKRLPPEWTIELYVENGSTFIRLENPYGEGIPLGAAAMSLPRQIRDAVILAKLLNTRR